MNYKDKLIEIDTFLKKHSAIWNEEIIHNYPNGLNPYPKEWIDSCKNLSEDDLWKIDCGNFQEISDQQFRKSSFYELLKTITALIPSEELKSSSAGILLEKSKLIKIKNKKKHEIEQILGHIQQLQKERKFENAIDLGGGIGNLARFIAEECQLPCSSIDNNKDLQESGISRLKRYYPQLLDKVTFHNLDFSVELPKRHPLLNSIGPKSLVVGLHTCGHLAIKTFELGIKKEANSILNFGCCYLKMDPLRDINLSSFCKTNCKLNFSCEALTLASRSHAPITKESFLLKRTIKSYRYTLHFILYHHFDLKVFFPVGDERPSVYQKDFGHYALLKFQLKNLPPMEPDFLNSYFASSENQNRLSIFFIGNIIRWRFGRLIELALLLDRVIYLEEAGLKCSLKEHFDSAISPRNIGITANR